MTRKLLLALCMLFGLFAISAAQDVDPEMAKQSTAILTRMRKVELLNELLPLILEKQQINRILPTIEKIRAKQRKLIEQEHKDLLEFDQPTVTVVDDGVKGKMPSSTYVTTILAFYHANDIRRQVAMGENLDILMPALKQILNPGQLKVMANSLTVTFFEPDLTPNEMNDETKMRVFAREVLLDPLTYDLLLQMAK